MQVPINKNKSSCKHTVMQNASLVYQRQSIMNASPLKLVVKMYDLLIQASYREDDIAREILSGLIQGLNFDYEPAGNSLNYTDML